jgi:predicted RNase H-like HicB family nuclease
MTDHHIDLLHSDEDGGYIAEIPDLPGCSAFGRTPQQAVAEVVVAKEAWMAAATTEDRPIPKPRYQPASARPDA